MQVGKDILLIKRNKMGNWDKELYSYMLVEIGLEKGFHGYTAMETFTALDLSLKISKTLEECKKLCQDAVRKKLIAEWDIPASRQKELEEMGREKVEFRIPKKKDKITESPLGFTLMIDNYTSNVELFYQHQPFFYDKAKMFWIWNKDLTKYEIKDDIDIMSLLDDILGFRGQTVNLKLKSQYLEAFKRIGRKHIPKQPKKEWIQFTDKAISLSSSEVYEVTPDYFFTNPIPWKMGKNTKTPVMDKLIEEWVGKEYVQTVYELIAYCCYTSYPIQLIFCLCGIGRNGKTCLLKLISNFVGNDNVCSTDLNLILGANKSRFEVFKLFKKLVCLMGETNFSTINDTTLLKKLVGSDMIGFEKKGKDPFDDFNYAKILIASNSLPSSQDTSEGYHRRWLILNFPNEFPEGKDIMESVPDEEYNNLCKKIFKILQNLLEKGEFHKQGTIAQRKSRYVMASNPLPVFLNVCCYKEEEEFVSYAELYTAFVAYLKANKKRKVSQKEFKSALEDEGFWVERESKKVNNDWKSGRWITGVNLTSDWKEHFYDVYDDLHEYPTQPPIYRERYGNHIKSSQTSQKKTDRLTTEEALILTSEAVKDVPDKGDT